MHFKCKLSTDLNLNGKAGICHLSAEQWTEANVTNKGHSGRSKCLVSTSKLQDRLPHTLEGRITKKVPPTLEREARDERKISEELKIF